MTDLLFWFLVSQTIAGLPAMDSGTAVWLMSDDLFSKYGTAVVEAGTLQFDGPLEPNSEIRLLIYPPNASSEQRVDALNAANQMVGQISPTGDDIWVQFAELEGPLSFRKWLLEERGIVLLMPHRNLNGGE